MDSSTSQNTPAWIIQPAKLINALTYSEYYNDTFADTTSLPDQTQFGKSITQFLYWKRRLAPSLTPHTVIFALLGPEGLTSLNIMDVIMGVKRVCNMQGAYEFYQAANPKFIGISFSTPVDMAEFTQRFKFFKNYVVAYVQPISEQSRNFSILWLPPLFNINRVKTLLDKYSKHTTMHHGTIRIGPNSFLRSSVVRGTITIRDGISFEDIPHLIPLPTPHNGHALLIIAGRDPFCLKCLTRGHLRKDCPINKCTICNFHHSPGSTCEISTYAKRVAGTSTIGEKYCWPDDVVGEEAPDHGSQTASINNMSADQHLNTTAVTNQHSEACQTTTSSKIVKPISTKAQSASTSTLILNPDPPLQKSDHTLSISTNSTTLPEDAISTSSLNHSSNIITPSVSTDNTSRTILLDKQDGWEDTMGLPLTTDLAITASAPVTTTTLSRTPNTSKVRIVTEQPTTASTPRSLIIPYSPFQQAFVDSNQLDMLPTAATEIASLFQDLEEHYYSSDTDNSSDHTMSIGHPDYLTTKSSSRKRKGTPSSSQLRKSASSAIISSASNDTYLGFTSANITNPLVNTQNSSSTSQITPAPARTTHLTGLLDQVVSLFDISPEQASQLVDLCPRGQLTADILKSLKLLYSHNFSFTQILGSPHILKLKHLELKRKVKHLDNQLGLFTLDDIWAQKK